MSIPSINIRLDFGASDASGAVGTSGPPPVELGGLEALTSDSSGAPAPVITPTVSGGEVAPPTPEDLSTGAAFPAAGNDLPVPSADIPGLDQGSAGSDQAPPEPEGVPEGSEATKKPSRDK